MYLKLCWALIDALCIDGRERGGRGGVFSPKRKEDLEYFYL
jgi:hypothetical protein